MVGAAAEVHIEQTSSRRGSAVTNLGTGYWAGFIGSLPHVNQLSLSCPSGPKFDGTITAFLEMHKGNDEVIARLKNKVRVCACGKACAYTLKACNSCNAPLTEVPITFNDNVFMGFIFGIARGRFPYTISMRFQSETILCFDDPLAISPCHLNAIPTSVYIPDCRYLFMDPKRGLDLVNELFDVAANAALEQYWGDEAFRRKVFRGRSKPKDHKEVANFIAAAGFNFPPSMYQLHLQFIHGPMLPFHYQMLCLQEHFTHGRFFPLKYIQEALSLGDKVKVSSSSEPVMEDIIKKIEENGVKYDDYHAAMYRRAHDLQAEFSTWVQEDFTYKVIGDEVFKASTASSCLSPGGPGSISGIDTKKVQRDDTQAIQNYGRPYDQSGKPTGTYYKYAKDPSEVASFP